MRDHVSEGLAPSALLARALGTGLLCIVCGLMSSACVSTQALQAEDIRPLALGGGPASERVVGLRERLRLRPQSPTPVLMLHGMRTDEPDYSAPLQQALGGALGLELLSRSPALDLPRGYDFVPFLGPQPFAAAPLPLSQLRRSAWGPRSGHGAGRERLVFYELLWAPTRDRLKNDFFACFERGGQACPEAGAARAQPGQTLEDQRLVVITHSLGSFLYLDTVQALERLRSAPVEETGVHLEGAEQRQADLLTLLLANATLFMNANQLGLLSLARLNPRGCQAATERAACPNPWLRQRGREGLLDWFSGSPTRQAIAFNDVNDLLGFELPPQLAQAENSVFVNVSVSNPGWQLPGLAKSPAAAHTAQARNPALIQALVDGFDLPRRRELGGRRASARPRAVTPGPQAAQPTSTRAASQAGRPR